MRQRTVISVALLMAMIGLTTAACGNMKTDPNSFQFIENRNDP